MIPALIWERLHKLLTLFSLAQALKVLLLLLLSVLSITLNLQEYRQLNFPLSVWQRAQYTSTVQYTNQMEKTKRHNAFKAPAE